MTLEAFYKNILIIEPAELRRKLLSVSKIETLNKNDYVIRQGAPESAIYFLMEGVAYSYMIDQEGNEHVTGIVNRPGAVLAGMADHKSGQNLPGTMMLTRGKVVSVPQEGITKLMEAYPEMVKIYIRILEAEIDRERQTKEMLYKQTAQERYQWFLSNFPGVIDQVNHRKVAAYLGVSPVTLSRVRSSGIKELS